jgi:hypothetical protein
MFVYYNSYLYEQEEIVSPKSALPPGIPKSPFLGPFFYCTKNTLSSLINNEPAETYIVEYGGIKSFLLAIHL